MRSGNREGAAVGAGAPETGLSVAGLVGARVQDASLRRVGVVGDVAAGLLRASLLAASIVPLSGSYAVAEVLGVERSVSDGPRQAPVFFGLFTTQLVVGAAVALVPGNLIGLVVDMQVQNGVITPVLLAFVLVLANRRSILGAAANGRVFRIVATTGVAAVGALALLVVALTALERA